jgi:DNA replication protein DnaC
MKQALPQLEKMATDFTAHCQWVREQMVGVHQYCPDHEEEELPIDWEYTFGRSWQQNKLMPCYKSCPMCEMQKKHGIVNDKWLKMGIPNKLAKATLENFILDDAVPELAKARKAAFQKVMNQLIRGNGFIILLGKFGTGKSHLGAAAIRYKGEGIFITMNDIISELRLTYGADNQREDFADRFRETPVLVLDEVSTEVRGTDIAPLLYRILSYRHDNDLLTILTSNEELQVVKTILGGRLVDRIAENYTVANFTWESARRAQHENH